MGRYKFLILKTAAVALTVSVLIMTGCQGGNDEAAAVKNKGTVSIEIHEAKGEDGLNVISKGDREETVETVDRSNGHEGRITQAEDNDTERDKGESGREQEAAGEAEPSEDGDSVLAEEDGSDVDGYASDESDTASAVYSEPDMGDGEYTDDADGWYEPDTAGVEAEEGYTDEYSDSGVDESGYSDGAGDNLIYQGEFLVTFYDDCEACCGRAGATTASGVYPTAGHTIAADGYEFGTVLYIEGFGYYVVEDRGVPYGMIDIFVNDHSEIPSYGITTASVYLVN